MPFLEMKRCKGNLLTDLRISGDSGGGGGVVEFRVTW
jgi:hypothetical protein